MSIECKFVGGKANIKFGEIKRDTNKGFYKVIWALESFQKHHKHPAF